MTEIRGDLISRSALKEAIENLIGYSLSYEAILNAIDNAPTVEIPVARWDCYCEGQKVGYEKALSERSQGKWIEKVETKQLGHGWLTTHEIVCSVCGGSGENDENIPQCWKFCPNCGADMRGGKEE